MIGLIPHVYRIMPSGVTENIVPVSGGYTCGKKRRFLRSRPPWYKNAGAYAAICSKNL